MPIAVNDIIQLTVLGEKDNQACLNVLHFRCSVAPSTGTVYNNLEALQAFLFDVGTGFYWTEWSNCLPDNYLVRGTRAQVVAPVRSGYMQRDDLGAGAVDPAGLNVSNLAWVIVKQTDTPGRRGRGTLHICLSSLDWIESGMLSAIGEAARVALRDKLDDTIVVTAGGTYEPIIYNPGFSPNFHRITHCTIKQEIRTMSRRTVGRGI